MLRLNDLIKINYLPQVSNQALLPKNAIYVLSRFISMRMNEENLEVESVITNAKITLMHTIANNLIFQLRRPCTMHNLDADIDQILLQQFIKILYLIGIITYRDENNNPHDEVQHNLLQWEWHDLVFHQKSRKSRADAPHGGTFRFKEMIKPLKNLKSPMASESIKLPSMNIKKIDKDLPFQVVLNQRRSRREPVEKSLPLPILAEFLQRACEIQVIHTDQIYENTQRRYPSGGGIHELEIYFYAQSVTDLTPAIYHYLPLEHALEKLDIGEPNLLPHFVKSYQVASANAGVPHVLFAITARFNRVNWKYSEMAYALILKNVGVLYQTFYLVATAMNLRPCAIGSGSSRLFSDLINLSHFDESVVGEFILSA